MHSVFSNVFFDNKFLIFAFQTVFVLFVVVFLHDSIFKRMAALAFILFLFLKFNNYLFLKKRYVYLYLFFFYGG